MGDAEHPPHSPPNFTRRPIGATCRARTVQGMRNPTASPVQSVAPVRCDDRTDPTEFRVRCGFRPGHAGAHETADVFADVQPGADADPLLALAALWACGMCAATADGTPADVAAGMVAAAIYEWLGITAAA